MTNHLASFLIIRWEVEPQEDDIDIEDLPEIFTTDKEFLSKWGETHQQVTQQTKEVFGNIGVSIGPSSLKYSLRSPG